MGFEEERNDNLIGERGFGGLYRHVVFSSGKSGEGWVGLDVVDPSKLKNGVRTWCKRAWGAIAGF